jgi:hypothetical protein
MPSAGEVAVISLYLAFTLFQVAIFVLNIYEEVQLFNAIDPYFHLFVQEFGSVDILRGMIITAICC